MTLSATPATCRCGARRYPDQETASAAEPHGAFKCPQCHTFALNHAFVGGGDERCGECDTRFFSHGGPA